MYVSIDFNSLDLVLFNHRYTVMILTYNSALNKETNVKNPVRNHVRDESSGSDSCSGLNSHERLWSEQLPLRAPRVGWDQGSLQHWPATIAAGNMHQDDWRMLEVQPTLTTELSYFYLLFP